MLYKTSPFLLVLLLCCCKVSAQTYLDVVKVDYAFSPNNAFEDTAVSTHLHDVNGELTIPIKLNERMHLITGCYFEYSAASFDPGRKKEAFYGTILKLGVNIKHSEKWSGTYMFLPKLSSDLKKIGQNDFQFGGYAMIQYTKSPRLNYKIGMYANGDKFGPFLVPLLGIYFLTANEKLEIKAVLPFAADMNYSFTKKIRFGLNFKGIVRSYNVNASIGTEQNRYITKSTNEVCAYFQTVLKQGLHFQVGIGRTFARSFRMYDEQVNWGMPLYYNGDSRQQLNRDFSNGWLFKIGIIYRINL